MNIKLQHMITVGVTLGMAGCLDQGPVADADATAELAEPPAAITQQILAGAAASTFHQIKNRLYVQCMDAPGGAFNVILKLANCNFLSEQHWAFVAAPAPNTFFLVNQLTGLCAEVNNGTAIPGERVDEFTCNGSTAEQWVSNLFNVGGTVYQQFQHAGTNQCLDTVGAQGSQLMQFNCDLTGQNQAQQWLVQ
ncbi:MAG TPA: RICIN domain-containing protein [Kofleriaceae bacterium]